MITATFVDSDSFTVSDDQTTIFHQGRRVRCDCDTDGYKYGTITSSSYSSPNTTVNLTAGSDDLTSNLESVKYGIVGKNGNESLPVHDHSGDEGSGGLVEGDGVTDHGELDGLGDDDHSQYHNDTRHDAHDHSTALGTANANDLNDITSTGANIEDAVTKKHSQNTDTALGSGAVADDHGAAVTDQIVNVCYGTGDPPTANTTTIGTLWVKYTA